MRVVQRAVSPRGTTQRGRYIRLRALSAVLGRRCVRKVKSVVNRRGGHMEAGWISYRRRRFEALYAKLWNKLFLIAIKSSIIENDNY